MSIPICFLIIIPVLCAAALFCAPEKYRKYKEIFFITAVIFNLWAACFYFGRDIFSYSMWAAYDFSFSVIITKFTSFLIIVTAFFAALTAIFTVSNMKDNPRTSWFGAGMLLALAFANGSLITDSLVVLLVFIEALAIPFVIMIISSANDNKKLALKAFTITAVADLFLMMGIGIIYSISRTMNISEVSLTLSGALPIAAFVFIAIGAAGKLGVMPFHSWMPEASEKTPVPFMVFMATAVEKVLGVYILIIALKMFNVMPGSCVTYTLIAIVSVSAILAALLSNSQKSFKKMLIYTSISQGSFMMIAVLTAFPAAIAGAVLHLLAHTIYKSSLFFGAGIIDDSKFETISYKKNPYIFLCFIFAVASFIGVPLFAAHYSKEFIYEGAMHSGAFVYVVMLLVTFFCSSAVLNWFGKIFFGNDGKFFEYPVTSMIPAVTTALLCLFCGIFYKVPLTIIQLRIPFEEHKDMFIFIMSVALLVLVLVNFIAGYRKKNGLGFIKYIVSALRIDKLDDNESADPYNAAMNVYGYFAKGSFSFDKALNWVYDAAFVNSALFCSNIIKKAHNGSMSRYIIWVLCGIAVIILFFI